MKYEEAIALINQNPTATYVANVNGYFYTLRGPVMKGFLISADTITYFKRFE